MNKSETIDLWLKCQVEYPKVEAIALSARSPASSIWNAWAQQLIDEQSDLKEKKLWAMHPDMWSGNDDHPGFALTMDWALRARVDFRGHVFRSDAVFDNFIFPGTARFEDIEFAEYTSFDNVQFLGNVDFSGSTFYDSCFSNVNFARVAKFYNVKFLGECEFGNGELWFDNYA